MSVISEVRERLDIQKGFRINPDWSIGAAVLKKHFDDEVILTVVLVFVSISMTFRRRGDR